MRRFASVSREQYVAYELLIKNDSHATICITMTYIIIRYHQRNCRNRIRHQEEKYIFRRHCITRAVKLSRVQIADVIIIFVVSASCTHYTRNVAKALSVPLILADQNCANIFQAISSDNNF